MDHFPEGGHSERQNSRTAFVDLRPRAGWAAAAGDAGAALAARQYHRRTDEEARKAVRDHVEKGMDGFKVLERVSPEVAKAIADEARKLGKPVIGHSVNMWETIDAGYTSIEHSWAVMFTTIKDPKKRAEVDMNRMVGKVGTVEAHANMVPEQFDEIIKAMVAKDIHFSPTWATQFRALSPRAAEMKKRELATLKIPT